MDIPVRAYVHLDKHTQSYVTPDPEYCQIYIKLRFYLLIYKTHNLLGTLQQRPFDKHPPRTKDEQSLEKQRKKPNQKMDIFGMGSGERCYIFIQKSEFNKPSVMT